MAKSGWLGAPPVATTVLPNTSPASTWHHSSGGITGVGGQTIPWPPEPVPLETMLAARFRKNHAHELGFRTVHIIQSGETVYVVVVPKDGDAPVVVPDEAALYPSDVLMSKLRLLQG